MVLGLPLAHIPSYFADHRHRRHDIDAIDLGQVRTGHAKQLFPQKQSRHKKRKAQSGVIRLLRVRAMVPATGV